MVKQTDIFVFISIVVQVNADDKLFSLFHQETAKRFDQVKNMPTQPVVWYDMREKTKKYFKTGGKGEDSSSSMGYFIHVVPELSISRRVFQFNPYEGETVIGVPSDDWHLPSAEPILPGHTLVRPTLGMLKSAVTFPHGENSAGVYGNEEHLGTRYGGTSDRILYSINRRMLSDDSLVNLDSLPTSSKPARYYLTPVTLNSVRDNDAKDTIVNILQKLNSHLNYGHRSSETSSSKKENIIAAAYFLNEQGRIDAGIEKIIRRAPKISAEEIKSKQFWNMKNMFDHVKINSNKPELTDLIPPDPNKVPRNWWYFNEEDLSQLEATL